MSGRILRAKWRYAVNAVRHIPGHMYLHAVFGVIVVGAMLVGGTKLFYEVFSYLMGNGPAHLRDEMAVFGPPLMDKLVGIVFLAFFSMLIFSNLIITLSTSYMSREVDFLMAMPVDHSAIFRQKLVESVLYSSWAFVVLSLPFFVAFGLAREAAWYFYPLVALLVVPYLAIPAILGSLLTMVVTAFLPARRTRTLVIALAVLSVAVSFGMARAMGLRSMFAQADEENFMAVMGFLSVGSSPLLPSSWMMSGVLSLAPGTMGPADLRQFLYWFAMLGSTALFLWQCTEWLVGRLYYRGWCLTKDSSDRRDVKRQGFSPLVVFDKLIAFVPIQYRTLLSKDMRTFWRDPSQWTQLVILFGLLVIYTANLRAARNYSGTVELLVAQWRSLLAFFNIGATGFVLSILTTRFVYPMLSLEGRQFWSIGLAPMNRRVIVWQKYALCLGSTLALSLVLLVFSSWVLQVDPMLQLIGFGASVLLAFGLSGLCVGLGALLPNFREDNPARIANGVGGTANALLSMFYIGATVAMIAVPMHLFMQGRLDGMAWWNNWWPLYVAGFVLLQVATIWLPMRLGLKRWEELQF